MRRLLVLALLMVSMMWLLPAKASAGFCGWYARGCGVAAPIFPSTVLAPRTPCAPTATTRRTCTTTDRIILTQRHRMRGGPFNGAVAQ